MTPPPSINEEYSDDESVFTFSTECDSFDSYESNSSSDYCESENEAYELYLQKILFEEEHKRELLLQTFGYQEDSEDSDNESTIVRLSDLSRDSEIKPITSLYFDN